MITLNKLKSTYLPPSPSPAPVPLPPSPRGNHIQQPLDLVISPVVHHATNPYTPASGTAASMTLSSLPYPAWPSISSASR
ncbi:hypothetical protein BC938DRAFT_477431 [Jimgerdemannia flammicorona]|uniref:Uncharacterized protein n=1 Tax=Jimgerdemannia flammicorona TaxID=994334 RepID=A0A433QPA8_9FUNG|nr:hypothetical protein BC938DRAFT_477431 [Jimgerdemannia flammicorona]